MRRFFQALVAALAAQVLTAISVELQGKGKGKDKGKWDKGKGRGGRWSEPKEYPCVYVENIPANVDEGVLALHFKVFTINRSIQTKFKTNLQIILDLIDYHCVNIADCVQGVQARLCAGGTRRFKLVCSCFSEN